MARPQLVALVLLVLGLVDLVLLNLWLVPAAWAPTRTRANVADTVVPSAVAPMAAEPAKAATPRPEEPAAAVPEPRDRPTPNASAAAAPPAASAEPRAAEPPSREVYRTVVLFGFDADELDPIARDAVAQAVRAYREQRSAELEVDGHTDASGGEAYNVLLSERRARAVAKALEQAGVPAARITARGYGPLPPPAAQGHTSAAQQRRVDIVVRSSAS